MVIEVLKNKYFYEGLTQHEELFTKHVPFKARQFVIIKIIFFILPLNFMYSEQHPNAGRNIQQLVL